LLLVLKRVMGEERPAALSDSVAAPANRSSGSI